MKRNQLTAQFVKSIREPGKYQDGGGLMLVVKATGSRQWVQRLIIQGKRRDIGLGAVDRVSLARVRRNAFDNRELARAGGDPTKVVVERTAPTFTEAFEAVLDLKLPGWKLAGKSEGQWRATMRDYMFPLADMQMADIRTEHVLEVLAPIWHAKHETARRVKQRIGEVMEWAIAHDHRVDNPAMRVSKLLGTNGHHREHFKALPYTAVGGALAKVRASGAWVGTKLAFEYLVLVAARSGEVRGATWCEVDMDAKTWTIPAVRMKGKREHVVPLSDAALAVLTAAREIADGTGLLFPSATGRAMSDSTLSKLVKELGIDGTPHGMRSAFRQFAAERTNIPREVCEIALAHVNPNRVEAAYQRSSLFDKRAELMNIWARFLNTEHGAKVVAIR